MPRRSLLIKFTTGLVPLETTLFQMLSRIIPLTAIGTLPLVQCFDRTLATDVISPINMPESSNSAMDSYAVRLADLQLNQPLAMADEASADQPFHDEWPAGTYIRIMTGTPMPAGREAVVTREQTEQADDSVRFTAEVRNRQNICLRDEDIINGTVVSPIGAHLTTAKFPVLALLGIVEALAVYRIHVVLLSTSDGLQSPDQPLSDG